MVLGASLASLGLSAGGLFLYGSDLSVIATESLQLLGAASAFCTICLTEAAFSH